jgi:HK97 family phage prohead protease
MTFRQLSPVELAELTARRHATGALAVANAQAGMQLRDVWTTAYVNDLPDSSFLYIAPGGRKDGDGKTMPRSLRYFPVKDADGTPDAAHIRNALARIPQASSIPASARAEAMTMAKKMAAAHADIGSGPMMGYEGAASSGRSRLLAACEELPVGVSGYQERTFELIMEVRSTGDGRTLYGRAVPYNVVADVGGFRERFVPGVFSRQVGSGQVAQVRLFDAHEDRLHGGHPIGKTVRLAEQPDGLYGEWHLHDTSRAEDALKLVRAGEVTGLSVGFTARGAGSRRDPAGVIERRAAHLDHVALTHEPVYSDARVLGVRSRLPEYEADRERLRIVVG